jgi:hypothetical protein
MGKHDKHLPPDPYNKAASPADTPNLDLSTRKRIARGNALRTKQNAKDARQGDRR